MIKTIPKITIFKSHICHNTTKLLKIYTHCLDFLDKYFFGVLKNEAIKCFFCGLSKYVAHPLKGVLLPFPLKVKIDARLVIFWLYIELLIHSSVS